ncbi:diaminopimelate epimerase [Candidatus Pelagibacter ubique]|jgi:diaminopimelate epimerase|nr:diaminopimelate epimerase [Candidatus Pelagibacter bacterium]MDA7450280.1 diaminopimelate epimerase [Candidatus Pelagibacter ubique]MDA7457759.1 diaminopimelate epimerase [Candidatus Pelagibacter ubique]MDA7468574.1 diaminopimelate epimerase [Candidatus Pelagibacter ubique]MDA7481738.1 diaminopimelate epimerase [Candidatus Pelagibacter ubique]MDA8835692.1 diaminopimelate epimerase [Candidatus Pelagibacter bacterium]
MDIKAFKMDGLGNDFVIIDQRSQDFNLDKDQIIKICDRSFIGCDQLILIKKNKEIDANVEFFNSDGSISGACGNGTRCVADLLSKESGKKEITLLTTSGSLKSKILGNNLVETEIGIPKVNWQEIPLSKQLDTQDLKIEIIDRNNTEHIGGIAINVGNPHIIFFVDDIEAFDLKNIGPKIENHPLFPEKCNVTLAKVINRNLIKVKVWERGAGLTKACGTAACATAVAANINNLVEKTTDIEFALGSLTISIDERNSIHMKGPVSDIKNINIKL